MKRRVMALILSLMLLSSNAFAQGYPVIDITNIIVAIENGFTMFQQLMAFYESIKTSYQMIEQNIKSFEAFDFRQLDAKDPLGSWRAIMTYGNRMMNYEQNIHRAINNPNIQIGNESWSLHDIFTSRPSTTIRGMGDAGYVFMMDPFERKLSDQEKAIFHQRYGMSYGNYMRYRYYGENITKKAERIQALSGQIEEQMELDAKILDQILADGITEVDSVVKTQQAQLAMMRYELDTLMGINNKLGQLGTILGNYYAKQEVVVEEAGRERGIRNFDAPTVLGSMIDKGELRGRYR